MADAAYSAGGAFVPQAWPSGSAPDATYLTADDETSTLTNSRQLVAGDNITLDASTPGVLEVSASGGGGGSLPINNTNGDPVVSLDGNDNVQLTGYDTLHAAQNTLGFDVDGTGLLNLGPMTLVGNQFDDTFTIQEDTHNVISLTNLNPGTSSPLAAWVVNGNYHIFTTEDHQDVQAAFYIDGSSAYVGTKTNNDLSIFTNDSVAQWTFAVDGSLSGEGGITAGTFIPTAGYKSVDGSDGVSAGPFTAITGITVKNGLITAIAGT